MSNNNNNGNLNGTVDVLKRLSELKESQIVTATRTAGRKAMKIVADDAARTASSFDNSDTAASIAENIAIKTSYSRVSGDLTIKVGVLGGARYRRGDKEKGITSYWRYVEFGTEHSAAQPFLRPAIDNNHQQVFQTFMNELRAGINRRLN
ncbi:HK97 gp10 family phage protein [Halomonas sp. ISL-60]|uniref:HK97-gp10 family putative phage morphogenesis protein n=1 Tax=Halomonas sp. ISL-56 TaxID=2819149 RepID=UPI001BE68A86|nr:HK97 gp10 family phage protein [Halomonas sp. ISL-60]MBT2800672.1 HK97 gp10 family phage protein [Halomonas sp. ISL-56]